MRPKLKRQQARDGFVLAMQILVAFLTFTALLLATEIVLRPGVARPGSLDSRVPPGIGWLIMIGAGFIIFRTAHIWTKGLPGVFGVATLTAFGSLFTGATPGSVRFGRGDAAVLTIMAACITTLSTSLLKRRMTRLDRVALTSFVYVIVVGAVMCKSPQSQLAALGLGTVCLLVAWFRGRERESMASPLP